MTVGEATSGGAWELKQISWEPREKAMQSGKKTRICFIAAYIPEYFSNFFPGNILHPGNSSLPQVICL